MRSKLGLLLKWCALCVFVIVAASFGRAFYLRYKTARMHSQCSVLAGEINNQLAKEQSSFSLDNFLASIQAEGLGGLIDRRDDGELVDSWGHRLLFEWADDREGRFVVVGSVGRDGVRGTSDDLWRPDIPNRASK